MRNRTHEAASRPTAAHRCDEVEVNLLAAPPRARPASAMAPRASQDSPAWATTCRLIGPHAHDTTKLSLPSRRTVTNGTVPSP